MLHNDYENICKNCVICGEPIEGLPLKTEVGYICGLHNCRYTTIKLLEKKLVEAQEDAKSEGRWSEKYFKNWQAALSVLDLIDRKLEAGKVDEAREIIKEVREK